MARMGRAGKRRRGFFGWIFVILFLLFNAAMAWWLLAYFGLIPGIDLGGEIGRVQLAVARNVGLVGTFWLLGDIILGAAVFFSRGRLEFDEDDDYEPPFREPDEAAPRRSRARGEPRWREPEPEPEPEEEDDALEEELFGEPDTPAEDPPAPPPPPPVAPQRSTALVVTPRPNLPATVGGNRERWKLPPQLASDRGWYVEVDEEVHYQQALISAAAGAKDRYDNKPLIVVILDPEDENPDDPSAIRVDSRMGTLGYLPRAAAREYRNTIGARRSTCTGLIFALDGTEAASKGIRYGIWLNAAWPPRFK